MEYSTLDLTILQQIVLSLTSGVIGAAVLNSEFVGRICTTAQTRLHLMRVKQIALADVYDGHYHR